jgi:hypothetical protein
MSRTAEALLAKQKQNITEATKENTMSKDKTPPRKPEQRQDVATHYDNPFLEAAAESGSEFGRLLKFNKGTWMIGDDEVKEGTEFVALMDQLMRGWIRFCDGKVTEPRVIGKISEGFKPPERNTLGDLDEAQWEKDENGNPRDPWVKQWFLPLVSVEDGLFCVYATGSKGGTFAISALCRAYGHRKDGLNPIVGLHTESYRHPKYGRIPTPSFNILGWDAPPTGPATPAAPTPVMPPNGKLPPTAQAATVEPDDGGDEITFNL